MASAPGKEPRPSPSADNLASLKKSAIHENPLDEVLESEHPWTVRDIGINAISGIINDPHEQAKSGQKPLKGMDSIVPVTPAVIRKVQTSEFDPYIKSLADVFGKYQLNRAVGLATATEGMPMLGSVDQPSPSFANLEELTSRLGVAGSEKRGSPGLSASQKNRLRNANVVSLDTVPSIFLKPEFNLSNPHTFATVCENVDITSATSSESTTTNGILQEKLSHYLDTVEVHLIREISRRSSSFFAALANLQALHHETQSCVAQIKGLREKLAGVSRTTTKKGLEVVRLKRRRGNLGVLYGGVKLVAEIRQSQPMIQTLLDHGDFVAALDMVENASLVLRGLDVHGKASNATQEQSALTHGVRLVRSTSIVSQALDLRRVKALASFSAQLGHLARTIGTMMENELAKVILADVQETVVTMDASKISPGIKKAPASNWVYNMLNNKYSFNVSSPVTPSFDQSLTVDEERLKSRLLPLVLGLLRMDRLGSALQLYKDALLKEVKTMSKKYYPPASALDSTSALSPMASSPMTPTTENSQQQSPLARQLRSMTFDAFFDLLLMVYVTLLHVLQRVAIVHQIIVVIVKEAQERGVVIGADSGKLLETSPSESVSDHPNKLKKKLSEEEDEFGSTTTLDMQNEMLMGPSPGEKQSTSSADAGDDGSSASSTYGQMISESSDVLFSASDLAHVRCAKLIGVRSEQNAQLNPADFFRLFGATWEFVGGGEALCGRMCFGLKGTLLSQAKAFINRFHEEKAKQVAHIVENEQWAQAEVPEDFQHLAEQFFAVSAPSSPDKRSSSEESLERQEYEDDGDIGGALRGNATSPRSSLVGMNASPGGRSQRYLVIDGQKYNVVACVLLFLKMLTEYVQCMENIPALTTDVLNRIADILKLFNSRTCQVILGAGAMRSAGLKNISAKHIALAAQSLGVVIAVIPHIKERIQSHLPPKQQILLGDFDRLLRDYKDHQSELYAKLLSIMEDFCLAQTDRLKAINWDNPEPAQFSSEESATVYMHDIVKQTVTLHKVLARYLPQDTMRAVMTDVFKSYNRCLGDTLKDVDLFTGAGKNRLLIDAQYLIHKLSGLDGVDGPGNHLEVVVNNIKIKDRRQSMAASSSTGRAASSDGGPGRPVGPSATPPPPPASSAAMAAAGGQRKSNFASAFGNMLKTKNANLPGGG
ncbi:hypothetical protein SpCBS45565_g05926 [Spizellomyces sp. 'palustris']|nr:hypothetical protein SpCBS45565_g05926 [Spizellomyces sp. 'palustris']